MVSVATAPKERPDAAALRHRFKAALERWRPLDSLGKVSRVLGTLIEGTVPCASIGEQCEVFDGQDPRRVVMCEVVGFTEAVTYLSPLGPLNGVSSAYQIRPLRRFHTVTAGPQLLGRILDGFGVVADGKPPPSDAAAAHVRPVIADAPLPNDRPRISQPFFTGVRSIDGLLTLGYGQRVGILAAPGCGKTTLMAAVGRGSAVDVVVVGLVGERGREVREFTEHEFDKDLLAKTVIVCATSDRTAIERVRAAFTATAIAEAFRDQGLRVLLMIDSLTRLARAQREIGLATGELPARAGFPPSVYALLPRLIERAGNTSKGSITALYTVLLDGEIKSDPISEEAVSLLDGHVLLSRKLAEQGHYPAVDVLPSISRVMSNIVDRAHAQDAAKVRTVLSRYKDLELLIRLGEYKPGLDAETDRVVSAYPDVISFLRQDTRRLAEWPETRAILSALGSR